jgi:molybdate transport system substrate-binding protein
MRGALEMRWLLAALLLMGGTAQAQEVRLHAAGSLRAALTEVATAFQAAGGGTVRTSFGPSGLLRERIAGGEATDVFAAANMTHPLALARARGRDVVLFARNRLCALVGRGVDVESETLLDRMLDPAVKLGTSTPRADPAGDYAFAAFARAEALRPGAQAALEAKALTLTGGAASAAPPAGIDGYAWHVAEGRADIFLTYCTNAAIAVRQVPGGRIVALPEALSVAADYGLVVLGDGPAASRLGLFILSPAGQAVLARLGFEAPTQPREPLP